MPSLNPIGIPFIELPTVESTNNYAMGLVRAGMAQSGTAVFAHEQTRGKGQRSKEWVSAGNQNIAISFIIGLSTLPPADLFVLSMATALAVRQLLSGYIQDEIKIKWPNDIYWCDRKAAGILIENVWQGQEIKFAIIGIGININQTDFGSLAANPVSVKQITGKEFSPLMLARELCGDLDQSIKNLIEHPSRIIDDYRSHLYKLNEPVKLKKGNRSFEAIIKDVTRQGELVVLHGVEEKFEVGEVEWVIPTGA